MDDIVAIAQIEMEAVDAADAKKPINEACRWPFSSVAADIFKRTHAKRMAQLEAMSEVA